MVFEKILNFFTIEEDTNNNTSINTKDKSLLVILKLNKDKSKIHAIDKKERVIGIVET